MEGDVEGNKTAQELDYGEGGTLKDKCARSREASSLIVLGGLQSQ